jgi:hypothetical protein
LLLALYSAHQKYRKKKKHKRRFRVETALSKQKILTRTSLQYSSFYLLNPCRQEQWEGPHCAETGCRTVTLATKQETLGLQSTGGGAG